MLGVAIGKHQVKIHLVDELETGFAISIVVVEIRFEKRITLMIEKNVRYALILVENGTDDFLVGH